MKSAAALGQPWQLRSQCRFICLADSSTPASLHALLYPAISGFIYSARRQILLFVVESAPANPLAFKRVLQPGAWGCLHPQLQESSYKGCSVKREETGSAYAFSALGALVSVFFLCRRLYSHLCLIASDGFIFQEFVQLLSGFIAVSICSSQWRCVTKEGVFSAEVLLLLCNFLLIKPFWALGFLFYGKSWWFFLPYSHFPHHSSCHGLSLRFFLWTSLFCLHVPRRLCLSATGNQVRDDTGGVSAGDPGWAVTHMGLLKVTWMAWMQNSLWPE